VPEEIGESVEVPAVELVMERTSEDNSDEIGSEQCHENEVRGQFFGFYTKKGTDHKEVKRE
jgi:hypothetical protein